MKGVKQNIVDMSDGCLEIPQFGTKHSLNVSVTAGIVVWEFAKLAFFAKFGMNSFVNNDMQNPSMRDKND